jgi:hypothetical protein
MSEAPTVPYESTEDPRHLSAHLERIAQRDYCGVNEGYWILRDAAAYIERLQAALKPFSDRGGIEFTTGDYNNPVPAPDLQIVGYEVQISVGDLRRARAALSQAQPQPSGHVLNAESGE